MSKVIITITDTNPAANECSIEMVLDPPGFDGDSVAKGLGGAVMRFLADLQRGDNDGGDE